MTPEEPCAQRSDMPTSSGSTSGKREVATSLIYALISRKASSTLRVSATENRTRKVSYIAFLSSLSLLILFKLDVVLCRVLGGHLHVLWLDTDSWEPRLYLRGTTRALKNKAGRHQLRHRLPRASFYHYLSDVGWCTKEPHLKMLLNSWSLTGRTGRSSFHVTDRNSMCHFQNENCSRLLIQKCSLKDTSSLLQIKSLDF